VPKTLLVCDDPLVAGRPFYVAALPEGEIRQKGAKPAANWVMGEVLRELKERKAGPESALAPARLAALVAAIELGKISASAAMATAGSREFFRAHHERGGLR
jgi:Asp-tRNA(Asn)/Glu-tRNA(Gln) amidotransferase B subunit